MEMKERPLVSVIIPVYNRPSILKTLNSILEQTYTNLEIIVIDNASTDDTVEIISSIQDARIKLLVNDKNMGQTFSMNRGIKESAGKYVARIDSDDIAVNTRIEKQVAYMEANKHCVLCGSWVQVINDNDEKLYVLKTCSTDKGIRACQILKCAYWHPAVLIRNDVLKKHNILYDEKYRYAEDFDMWSRILQYGQGHNIAEVLTYYRRGSENDSKKYLNMMWEESQEIKKRERKRIKNSKWNKILGNELRIENKEKKSLIDMIKIYHAYINFYNSVLSDEKEDLEIIKFYIKTEVFGVYTVKNESIFANELLKLYHEFKNIVEGIMNYAQRIKN